MICYLVFDDSYTKESNIRDIVRGYYEFLLSEVKKTELFFFSSKRQIAAWRWGTLPLDSMCR